MMKRTWAKWATGVVIALVLMLASVVPARAMSVNDCDVIDTYVVNRGVFAIVCNDGVPASLWTLYDIHGVGLPSLGMGHFYVTVDRGEGEAITSIWFVDRSNVGYAVGSRQN